jgi:hypothetical protein
MKQFCRTTRQRKMINAQDQEAFVTSFLFL